LPEARRILHLAESAAVSTRRTAAGYGFLPELITTARERLPGVDFVLEEMVTAEQVEGLASHRIDVALLRPPVRREFKSVRVLREPLLAALPAEHRLAKGHLPTLSDFDHQPLIMYSCAFSKLHPLRKLIDFPTQRRRKSLSFLRWMKSREERGDGASASSTAEDAG